MRRPLALTSAALAALLAHVYPLGAQPAARGDNTGEPPAATPSPAPPRPAPDARGSGSEPPPFGANLFLGNFPTHEDGLNPNYVVMPGDRVAVSTWGTVEIANVFVVDGQGNIFLPRIGPVQLAGVKNSNLTKVVKAQVSKTYRGAVGVYTNLLTAAPVAVFVTGAVSRPGHYAGKPSDTVLSFLDQAGGIDPELGSYRRVKVLRDGQAVLTVDLYDFLLSGKTPAHQFAEGDVVMVERRGPVVTVSGEVQAPARVELADNRMTGAALMRVVPSAVRASSVTIATRASGVTHARTISVEEFSSIRLVDGDRVEFHDDGRADTVLVRLEGEFEGASVLSVRRGAGLVDVLNYVKVDPEIADVKSVHLRRTSVARAQKKAINDSLARLERSALLALSATDKEADIRVKEAQLMQSFIESAKLVQPLGRVVTSTDGHQLNIPLQDGDVIVIPAKSPVVHVGGEVQMSHAVAYRPGLDAGDYIALAGGYTERSDSDKVIVLHPSAAVSVSDPGQDVQPGDQILVPPKADRKLLQNAADVTQVLYQIAVSAAVVLAL